MTMRESRSRSRNSGRLNSLSKKENEVDSKGRPGIALYTWEKKCREVQVERVGRERREPIYAGLGPFLAFKMAGFRVGKGERRVN